MKAVMQLGEQGCHMATRPVTWDLDIPPKNLLDPPKVSPPPGEVPSIDKLRASLMGTRFELVKISTFAAFLLSFVAVAVHGSHLTNPDNPFAANTSAALKGLATTFSTRTASLRGKTEQLALEATHKAQIALGQMPPPAQPVTVAQAESLTHGKHVARGHHGAHAVEPAIQTAKVEAQPIERGHHHAPVEVASAEGPDTSNAQWSGSLLDLPNFVTAEGSKAGQKILDAAQGGAARSDTPRTHKVHRAMSSVGKRANATAIGPRSHESSSILDGIISPDSLVAGMTALLLYTIFVFVLIQMKGGLRALSDGHAAV
jgi:hypothetical protein